MILDGFVRRSSCASPAMQPRPPRDPQRACPVVICALLANVGHRRAGPTGEAAVTRPRRRRHDDDDHHRDLSASSAPLKGLRIPRPGASRAAPRSSARTVGTWHESTPTLTRVRWAPRGVPASGKAAVVRNFLVASSVRRGKKRKYRVETFSSVERR